MHYCPLVHEVERLEELLKQLADLVFGVDGGPSETGGFEELHHQPASIFFEVQVQGLVMDDVAVIQPLHQYEIASELWNMLVFENERLGGILHTCLFFYATVDHSVRAFSEFV